MTTKKKPRGRPFKPGQSGNPAGKPIGAKTNTPFRQALARVIETLNSGGQTPNEDASLNLLNLARGGGPVGVAALKLLSEIQDGKPMQRLEATLQADFTIRSALKHLRDAVDSK